MVAKYAGVFYSANLTCFVRLILMCNVSLGMLITKPINIIEWTWAHHNQSINCSSTWGSGAIRWNFTLFLTTNAVTIAVGSTLDPYYAQWFYIDQPTPNSSNLVMPQPSNYTAGTYLCTDGESVASAQFVAVGDFVGYTNTTNSVLVNGDYFNVTLTGFYYGDSYVSPTFQLFIGRPPFVSYSYNITTPTLTKQGSKTIATITVIDKAYCGVNTSGNTCNVAFNKLNGPLPPGAATNVKNYDFGVIFGASLTVKCVPSDSNMTIDGAASGGQVYPGMLLICNVTSDPPVSYTWTDLTFGNSSIGPSIRVWHSGSYRCSASASLNGTLYSASKTLNNVTVTPFLSSADPLCGPITGGTNVTISLHLWSLQTTSISAVYFGTYLKANIASTDRSRDQLIVTTASPTNDVVGQPLPITIEFLPGPINFSATYSFSYLRSPKIESIDPQRITVIEGVLLTVYGQDLSSPASIQLTLVVQRADATPSSETTTEPCMVNNTGGNWMVCPVPPVDIPQDFLQNFRRQKRDSDREFWLRLKNSRRKRYTSAFTITGANGIDQAIVYLGFIFDGCIEYKNINDFLPDVQIIFDNFTLNSAPQIDIPDHVIEYDPRTREDLKITGKYLTRGYRISDYVVHVGSAICVNVDLQDSYLSCQPPETEPLPTQNDTSYCTQSLTVIVSFGYKEYLYACLKYIYPDNRDVNLIIGVCVGVGGFLLLVIAVIGIACYCKKCRNKWQRKSTNSDSNMYEIPGVNGGQDNHMYEDLSTTKD